MTDEEQKNINDYLEYYEKQYLKDQPMYHLDGDIRLYKSIINEIRLSTEKTEEVKRAAINVFTTRLEKMEAELATLTSWAGGAPE